MLKGEVKPWERDDVLVPAMAVEWIAKNVFLVAIPSYRRKISCELTAVDVPRGTVSDITAAIAAVLRQVNMAMRLYLRQDLYSNFPEEAYGDVIFSSETREATTSELTWLSLQEALVCAGVACVVRPSVHRLRSLLAAEAPAAQAGSSWLKQLQERERSPLCCLARRCVVEDVMRGDVYRVSWHPPSSSGSGGDGPSELPPLLILDSTVCHTAATQPGFKALRWAQLHLLHRELAVDVHAVYPSDRDVAFNTQLETYEHLANVRGSAVVVDESSSGSGCGSDRASADVGVALVTLGLGWVRRVTDAGVPRASNLFEVWRAVEKLAGALLSRGEENAVVGVPEADASLNAALGRRWSLPPGAAAGLLRFHDAWWRHVCRAACDDSRSAVSPPRLGATATVWNRTLWCADFHSDPNDEPRVYVHRPLRTLLPLAGLAEWRVRLQGQMEGAVVVRTPEGRHMLQVDVVTTTPAAVWRDLRQRCGYASLDVVRFSPIPDDAVLGKSVKVTITASGLWPEVETRLRVCCTSYAASTFALAQHTSSGVWNVVEGAWCVEELSVEGTAKKERVFVLDVAAETRDAESMQWTQRGVGRAVYLLSPDAESDPVDAVDGDDEGRDITSAAAAEKSAKENAAVLQSISYRSSLTFFFELRGGAADFLADLRRAVAEWMYEDVMMLPVGVAEVCGVRGLVGDLFLPATPPPRVTGRSTAGGLTARGPVAFTRSLLASIGRGWWPPREPMSSLVCPSGNGGDRCPWPMSTALCDAVQESFAVCLARVAAEEAGVRHDIAGEVEWVYRVLDQEALNTFPAHHAQTPFPVDDVDATPPVNTSPKHCLSLRAGDVTLWHDAAMAGKCPRLRLPTSLLPSTVPLSVFAARPRELFSVAATQKMSTMGACKASSKFPTLQEKSYNQQDWAFMRLHFPFLPNVLRCDWERLPLSLRNTERALCESLARDGGLVTEPGMLYSTDRIFSTLLAYLALLQAMQSSRTEERFDAAESRADTSPLAAVYEGLQHDTPSLWDDFTAPLHFSATLFVLPPYQAAGEARPPPHSRPLFLGSRDNVVSDAFEVPRSDNATPEVIAFPLLRDLTTTCAAAVALAAFTEAADCASGAPSVVNLDEGRRPDQLRTITGQGLPCGVVAAGTPVLFHPLPRVAVLASPLVERDEYTPEALGGLQLDHDCFHRVRSEPPADVMVRRRVVLQYRCANKFSEKSPYKTISYGRVSSVDMFKTLLSDRARGREVQAYMSLLIRRTATGSGETSAEWPDGLLTLHGLPSEALFVHYRSRADLRFTLSTASPPLRRALLQAERDTASAEAAEASLLTLLTDAAAAAVRKVYEKVRMEQRGSDGAQQVSLLFTLQPWDGTAAPYVALQVFPVHPSDAETTTRVLDQEALWPQSARHPGNPHRPFSLLNSRFGRLPLAELRLHYDTTAACFVSTWNDAYERGVNPTPAATTAASPAT